MIDKHIRLDDDVYKLVEDYQKGQSPIPSFNTAINIMLKQHHNQRIILREVPLKLQSEALDKYKREVKEQ